MTEPGRDERRLLDAIDAAREDMIALLADLVSLDTENPPARTYLPCVDAIEGALATAAMPHERIAIDSPAGAPRAAVRAWVGDGAPLYFHGHYDVVPAQSRDQFVPRVEGDTLFGRGSSDMKSGLVAMLYAARALRDARVPLAGRVELLFVPDEETGGEHGTAALVRRGAIDRHAVGMLLPEPTSGVVWNANAGAVSLEVIVKGRAAHVSLQHQGVNAFERALPLVERFLRLKRDVERRADSVLLVGGRVEAGSNFNTVPGDCRFTLDRRISPDEDFEVEKRLLFDVMDEARAAGIECEASLLQEGRASFTPPDGPLGRTLSASITDVFGAPAPFERLTGLLEIRFYSALGIPAFAYGPGILAVSHGPQEFVRISRMVQCAKVYALTAARRLSNRDWGLGIGD